MADEKTEEKTKQTVPGLVRTAEGVAEHAAAVQDRQWDKERKTFRDPTLAMLALFTYAKLTAKLLHESEARAAQERTTFEKRIAEFEARLTTMERWRSEAEAMTADMVKNAEELLQSEEGRAKLMGLIDTSTLPRPSAPLISLPKHEGENGTTEKKDDVA